MRRHADSQFDLFIPLIHDLSLKDQREIMERPFFSLAKRKRLKPIEYTSPDGDTWVKVSGNAEFGIATIWDADVMIWAASQLNRMKEQGINDLPRTLRTTSYDLLRAIKRDTGGKSYQELQAALQRLESTTIQTSIRAPKRKDKAQFGWIDAFHLEVDPVTEAPRGLSITLSDWVYQGIVTDKSLLTMHQDYFLLTGGMERALYRACRPVSGDRPRVGVGRGRANRRDPVRRPSQDHGAAGDRGPRLDPRHVHGRHAELGDHGGRSRPGRRRSPRPDGDAAVHRLPRRRLPQPLDHDGQDPRRREDAPHLPRQLVPS